MYNNFNIEEIEKFIEKVKKYHIEKNIPIHINTANGMIVITVEDMKHDLKNKSMKSKPAPFDPTLNPAHE